MALPPLPGIDLPKKEINFIEEKKPIGFRETLPYLPSAIKETITKRIPAWFKRKWEESKKREEKLEKIKKEYPSKYFAIVAPPPIKERAIAEGKITEEEAKLFEVEIMPAFGGMGIVGPKAAKLVGAKRAAEAAKALAKRAKKIKPTIPKKVEPLISISRVGKAKNDLIKVREEATKLATYVDKTGVKRIDHIKRLKLEKELLGKAEKELESAQNEFYSSLKPKFKIGDIVKYQPKQYPGEAEVFGKRIYPIQKIKITGANFDTVMTADQMRKTGFPASFKFNGLAGKNIKTGEVIDLYPNYSINGKVLRETLGKNPEEILKEFIVRQKAPRILEPPIPKPPVPPSPTPGAAPRPPFEDPVFKLNELIKKAKPARTRLETKYTAERAKRARDVEWAIDKIGGEKGYKVALSKLKGELVPKEAKVAFEPIKEKLALKDLNALYDKAWKHPYLEVYEKISTTNGLTRLLQGELPPASQLALMEEVYGTNLIKGILSKRALGLRATDIAIDALNIPRTLMATADVSAFLRQGIIYAFAEPKIWAKSAVETFKYIFQPKVYKQFFKDLPKDPYYSLMKKSKVEITDPTKVGLSGREEGYMTTLLQKVPIVGEVVKVAERAYVGFLNKLRVDVFKKTADELLSRGLSPVRDAEVFKGVAEVVNVFTGRGSMGRLNQVGSSLNLAFFSPRLIVARFQALNPAWYARLPKEIRVKTISNFGKFVGAGLTILALAKLNKEIEVEADPRSVDFGKIKVGDTRWDIWGGFQQWARVFTQTITGERKNTTTGEIISLTKDEYPFTTRKETVQRFFEGKLAPIPALVNELMMGQRTFGGDLDEKTVTERIIPMYIQDITDAYTAGGFGLSAAAGIPAFLGVGVMTYEERKKFLPTTGMPGMQLPSLPMPGMPITKGLPTLPGIK